MRPKEERVKRLKPVALLIAVALVVSSVVIAQDSGSQDQEKQDRPRSRARLVKPWSDLTTLSDQQKEQIIEIHRAALEEMRRIREKEHADIMAVLTDENKTEYAALMEKQKADAKARRAAAKDDDGKDDDDKDDKDK